MPRIDPAFLEQLHQLSSNQIVSIIDRRLKLQREGKNYKACCPFHDEKTPSFVVSPEKGSYHCFGNCEGSGGHGGAIDFVMKFERVDFPEAINLLARELNMGDVVYIKDELSKEKRDEARKAGTIKTANIAATTLFAEALSKNIDALRYLSNRGISPTDVEDFNLGFSPGSNYLTNSLIGRFTKEVLIDAGLVREDESRPGRLYDHFRDRIIFPIRNEKGAILGFGGRRIDNVKDNKYINTSTTLIFNKSQSLFGLYESIAHRSDKTERGVYQITEGYFDVISAHRHGYTNTVAPLGTAVTAEQIQMLFRRADKIRFMQDGDKAGLESMYKAIIKAAPFLAHDKTVTVVLLPLGEDVDSLLNKQNGKSVFDNLVRSEISASDFVVKYLRSKYPDTAEGNSVVIHHVNELLMALKDENLKVALRSTLYRELNLIDGASSPANSEKRKTIGINDLPVEIKNALSQVDDVYINAASLICLEPKWKSLMHMEDSDFSLMPLAASKLLQLTIKKSREALNDTSHPANILFNYLLGKTVNSDIAAQIECVCDFNKSISDLYLGNGHDIKNIINLSQNVL